MNLIYFIILIPILSPLIGLMIWKHKITGTEFALNVLAACLLTIGVYYATAYGQMADFQILNGEVIAKEKDRVHCEHSYQTCTGSGKSRTCTTHYEHAYDYDWVVKSNVGNFKINRVNRQGTIEPPRWTQVKLHEPVALEDYYVNYIKGSPSSIFNKKDMQFAEKYADKIPKYPEVYDYHKANRVFAVGFTLNDISAWNYELSEMLKSVGPQKQANVSIILTKGLPVEYASAVNAKWLGGKKNDMTLIVGTSDGSKIDWVQVLAYSKSTSIKTYLRDAIKEHEVVDRKFFMEAIRSHMIRHYDRKSMDDFSYLLGTIEISDTAFALIVLFSLISSLGISFAITRVDISFAKKPYMNRHRRTWR